MNACRSNVLALLLLCAGLVACGSSSDRGETPTAAAVASRTDWPVHGFDNAHTGFNPHESTLGAANVDRLTSLWQVDVGGWVTAQPVLAANVDVPGRGQTDVLYAGTEAGVLVAIDASATPAGDRVIWSRQLGVGGCEHKINGLTGSPVVDRERNLVYAVDGLAQAYALDLGTGEVASGWPVVISKTPELDKVWSGGTLYGSTFYTATAGYCGDEQTNPYRASVVAIDVETAQIANRWFPLGESGRYGGGIWAPAAVSVDEDGTVYAAVGNANGGFESFAFGEHVVRLTAALTPVEANFPGLVGFDVDLSSAPVLFSANGCPNGLVVMAKTGELLVYDRNEIARGPLGREAVASNKGLFLGMPAFDPETEQVIVTVPEDTANHHHGVLALRVGDGCALEVGWESVVGTSGISSPPTIANGVVYYGSGGGSQVFALDASTGAELWNSGTTVKGRIAGAPMVVNGRVYVASWDGHVYAFGLKP